MSSNPTGIKRYQLIRDYLPWIYIYGYFSREDFARLLPKKEASFSVCIQYIKDIYPELNKGKYRGKKKILALNQSAQPSDEDRLANTFFLSSLSNQELKDILQLLSNYNLLDSDATLSRRRSELEKVGYLERKRSVAYSVHKSVLDKLPPGEQGLLDLTDLYRYVRFCGNITYPRIPARYLLHSIEREFLWSGHQPPNTAYFCFLNSPNHNAMDEDLVYKLLELIRNRQKATVTIRHFRKERTICATPICLRVDRRLGRWYLLSMEDRPKIRRISMLIDVSEAGSCSPEEWEQAKDRVTEAFSLSRFSGSLPKDGPSELKMELLFDDSALERQFRRELRGGEIRTEGGRSFYYDRINDPVELVPLLRSYSPWLKPRTPAGIAERHILADLEVMRRQLSREVQE